MKIRLKKKYAIILLVLAGISLFAVVVGGSYAFFTHQVTSKDYVVYTGNLQVDYTKTGSLINLTNTYPKTNTDGLKEAGYSFNITNNGNIDARYQIRLELDTNNTIPIEYIKLAYVKEKENNVTTNNSYIEPVLLSNLNNTLTFVTNQQLEASKMDSYTLKMWIDYNAPNDIQGKTFKATIVIDSLQDVEDGYVMSGTRPIITLNKTTTGETDMHLLQNTDPNAAFTDPGVLSVKDDKDLLTQADVRISYQYTSDGENLSTVNGIDLATTGVYYINYEVTDSDNLNGTAVRVVTVNNTPAIPTITLNGASPMTLTEKQVFDDPGVTVAQGNHVAVIGEVKTSQLGSYTVRYIVIDANGNVNSVTRTVIVEVATSPLKVELYAGMVPVKYSDGMILVADPSTDWYDYDNHEWANAVLVNDPSMYLNNDGTVKTTAIGVQVSDIKQYYVYIPRYKYKLFSNATNLDNLVDNGYTSEQIIEIEFISTGVTNPSEQEKSQANGYNKNEWYVHPAFTFGETELKGIWVGKFETTGSTSAPTILPNNIPILGTDLNTMFTTSRSIEGTYGTNTAEIDTHIMRNMEWGAVAYLTNSKYGRYNSDGTCISSGCEIWINPYVSSSSKSLTGCSGTEYNSSSTGTCYSWTDAKNSGKSSTTGNLYGIYDMSGGSYEYVMGNVGTQANSNIYTVGSSNFSSQPAAKYIDMYQYNTVNNNYLIGKLGDATREVQKTDTHTGKWYHDAISSPFNSSPWFIRDEKYNATDDAGIFAVENGAGSSSKYCTFRVALTKEDSNT